ncbi:vitamin B12 ABC transporter substrate-binding protein BtuF [Erwinia sp. HDF1-3R]|uniref:vitamin B12 ABC transporter substrate-binding protein BtuF n=1 Tax=Erwinia sp. HDF1-3R TaxID=3141543 RepID=UPI0031F4D086
MANYRVLLLLWGLVFAAAAAPVPRVVTLAPNLTELAFAAGITPVAVSTYSNYPPAAAGIEQVASWQGINTERIIALKPDVVLAWRGGNPQRQVDQLRAFGLRVEWIDPVSLDQIIATVRQLKVWSPHPESAEQAASQLERQRDRLRQRYTGAAPRAVFLQFGQHPLFTASGHTLQNHILSLCGGVNIFADSRVAWPQVSREQVLLRHPAAIITPGKEAQAGVVQDFWQPQLNVPVIVINDDWFSRAGPRIILAAQQLCSSLHPER